MRTDNGTEYRGELTDILQKAGIRHQTTTPYTPEENGVAERLNRTLEERARCMIFNAGLTTDFWAEAVSAAVYIINRSPSRGLKGLQKNSRRGMVREQAGFEPFEDLWLQGYGSRT